MYNISKSSEVIFLDRSIAKKRILRDLLVTSLSLFAATLLCYLLSGIGSTDHFSPMIFILSVFIISYITSGYLYGILASVIGVVLVNMIFTYPYFSFNFTLSGYPITFIAMLIVSVATSTLATKIKRQDKVRAETEKEKMRGNLLRAISHDLRTPLTSIIGSASTILENENALSSTQRDDMLKEIIADSEWLVRVVENLLSITRIDEDSAKIVKHLEAVEEVVSEAVSRFRKRYSEVNIHVTVPNDPLFIPMDAVLIEQVLLNLLENAVIHGKTTTQIEIDISKTNDYAVFSISDNGKGFGSSQILENIFERSIKDNGQGTTDRHRNMGIGLTVCKTIITAHSGFISAYNRSKGGAIFKFTLPLNEE